jgi:hypothetical protein
MIQRLLLAVPFVPLLFAETLSLDSPNGLKLTNVLAESATFKGRKAVRITDNAPPTTNDAGRLALVPNTSFQDGIIEVDMTGDLMPNVSQAARGFVGMVFRATADGSRFECFYLRPTNGRADDQVRRNHSVQYISVPGFPWQLLRETFPEKYESYVDLQAGEWTKVKIDIKGDHARLFVHGGEQPSLIVNDLKQPVASGAVGLWVGPGTVAHFTNLRVTRQ